jgi:hypothetical protein
MRAQIGEVVKEIYSPETHPVSYNKRPELLSLLDKVKSQVINLELKIDGTNCICNIGIIFPSCLLPSSFRIKCRTLIRLANV